MYDIIDSIFYYCKYALFCTVGTSKYLMEVKGDYKMEKIYHMGIEATLDVIGGKWKPIILCKLGNQAMRSGELKRQMPNTTQKVLTQQLRELERDNIIHREVYNQVPPKVTYSLTEEGKTLRELLVAMYVWGENRIKQQQNQGENIVLVYDEHNGFLEM